MTIIINNFSRFQNKKDPVKEKDLSIFFPFDPFDVMMISGSERKKNFEKAGDCERNENRSTKRRRKISVP